MKRGVAQGDITSSVHFIIALELIMKIYDTRTDKDVSMCGTKVISLGHADDIALVDTSLDIVTSRVKAIS